MGRVKAAFLATLGHTLNPLTLRAARRGRGPFSLVRHRGRKSGRTFETPLILAPVPGGFVAELTYGDRVDWYRNILKGHGVVVHRGREYPITAVEPLDRAQGLAAFGGLRAAVLRLLRRHEFRMLRTGDGAPIPG